MLAAWQTLLYRYTNQQSIAIGVPTANAIHRVASTPSAIASPPRRGTGSWCTWRNPGLAIAPIRREILRARGTERVAQIATFGRLKAKAAIKDAARVLDQAEHVAHAENALGQPVRMKGLERVVFFADADEEDQHRRDRDQRPGDDPVEPAAREAGNQTEDDADGDAEDRGEQDIERTGNQSCPGNDSTHDLRSPRQGAKLQRARA